MHALATLSAACLPQVPPPRMLAQFEQDAPREFVERAMAGEGALRCGRQGLPVSSLPTHPLHALPWCTRREQRPGAGARHPASLRASALVPVSASQPLLSSRDRLRPRRAKRTLELLR